MDMTNQCVGDALSDMLQVESVLCAKGWDVQDWFLSYQVSMYTVPSRYIVDLETWSTLKHSLGKKTKVGKDSRPQKVEAIGFKSIMSPWEFG